MTCVSNQFASTAPGCRLVFGLLLGVQLHDLHASEIRFTKVTEESGITFALDVPDDAWFNYAHFFGGIGLADFDKNGIVGFGDFLLFTAAFGGQDADFDLDTDGLVGFSDFLIFASLFGQVV